MKDVSSLVVEFPLKGEWVAPNTPGDKIPSHGTDALGQRYAYDFIRIDPNSTKGVKFYKSKVFKYRTVGIPLKDCYCYKESIYSPVNGKVVVVKDGVREPKYLHPILDYLKTILRTTYISIQGMFMPLEKINLHKFIGNYIIIEFEKYYAFFAHISPGTIKVEEGQDVNIGDIIGQVGHSGNSTAPHLHFHIMDSTDFFKAKGVFCAFGKYYLFTDNEWNVVQDGIPKSDQIIRV